MCFYVGSEVVLANLLLYRKATDDQTGVSMEDISKYCTKLKQKIKKLEWVDTNYIYINVNPDSVDEAISRYKIEFKKFNSKYYINEGININYFNTLYTSEVAEVLKETAVSLNE